MQGKENTQNPTYNNEKEGQIWVCSITSFHKGPGSVPFPSGSAKRYFQGSMPVNWLFSLLPWHHVKQEIFHFHKVCLGNQPTSKASCSSPGQSADLWLCGSWELHPNRAPFCRQLHSLPNTQLTLLKKCLCFGVGEWTWAGRSSSIQDWTEYSCAGDILPLAGWKAAHLMGRLS